MYLVTFSSLHCNTRQMNMGFDFVNIVLYRNKHNLIPEALD